MSRAIVRAPTSLNATMFDSTWMSGIGKFSASTTTASKIVASSSSRV